MDELYDLLKTDYITENEFRAARANILREGGIDVTSAFRTSDIEITSEERQLLEEEESKGRGCGCFLFVLILIVTLLIGAFFALPKWPDQFGGSHIRVFYEQVLTLWRDVFSPEESLRPIPDPLASRDAIPGAVKDIAVAVPAVSSDSAPEPLAVPAASSDEAPSPELRTSIPNPERMASLNIEPPALPDAPVDASNITFVEIPSASASESVETAVRGTISARAARIRSTPDASTKDNIVGWGRTGDRFTVLQEDTDGNGAKWYLIRDEGGNSKGWISSSLVKLEQ